MFRNLWVMKPAMLPLLVVLLAAGCDNPQPRFHLNMVEMVNRNVSPAQQQTIADVLEAMYGTPDEPFALPETGLDLKKLQRAAGPVSSDQQGVKFGLYREHCAHCHGTNGDGMGPTAAFLVPYPRDFREGIFKFKSTTRDARPTRDDLHTVLNEGVQGTSMPSFRLLSQEDREALVEYVRYLSMRGETEIALARAMFDLDADEKLETTRDALIDDLLDRVANKWKRANSQKIVVSKPPADFESPASIAKGKELYLSVKANCAKCHGPTGLGDGQTTDYDDWNKIAVNFIDATKKLEADKDKTPAKLKQIAENQRIIQTDLLPPRTIAPRNLRQGIYRGGRAPYDLYYRLYAGINGTPMPGLVTSSGQMTAGLTQDDIWHLIAYVRSLPYAGIPLSSEPQQATVKDRL